MTAAERKQLLKHGTQKQIAEALGCSRGFVSEVVSGIANPTTEARKVAVRIARKVRLPVDDLFPEYKAA